MRPSRLCWILLALLLSGNGVRAPARVLVLGEVRAPGAYPWHPNMRVAEAIAAAGGLTAMTSLRRTTLRRERDGRVTMRYVAGPELLLEAGDVLQARPVCAGL